MSKKDEKKESKDVKVPPPKPLPVVKEGKDGSWRAARFGQDEDHSVETTQVLEKINASNIKVLLRSTLKPLDEYIDEILVVEKKARLGNDTLSGQRLCVEIISIYRGLKQHDDMLNQMEVLLKKRMQPKQVQSAMVLEAQKVLEEEHVSKERLVELLERLKFLTEGKIHVELEHARFAVKLAKLIVEESKSRKREASDLLQSVQVETITNMPRLEKLDCILQQLRLSLDIEDNQRTAILARKVNPRALAKGDSVEHKLRYFMLMIEYFERVPDAALLVAWCWFEVYLTLDEHPFRADDDAPTKDLLWASMKKIDALSNAIVLLTTAPHMTEKDVDDIGECAAFSKATTKKHNRQAWMSDFLQNKDLRNELPTLERILKAFVGVELIRMPLSDDITQLAASHPMFLAHPGRKDEVLSRLSEHDVLVSSRFYKRIHLVRLAELVGLSVDSTESFIMSLVSTKSIYARIDRVDGTVVFQKRANPVDVARQWNEGVEKITTLVDRAAHLVAKERMLRAVAA